MTHRIWLLILILTSGLLTAQESPDTYAAERIHSLLITLNETLSQKDAAELAIQSRTLHCLLQHCDQETRHALLADFVSLLTETYQQVKRSHESNAPELNNALISLSDRARTHLTESHDFVLQRFWHETPGNPAYHRPHQTYTEPLQLLIPVVIAAIIFLARDFMSNKRAEKNQSKYDNANVRLTEARTTTEHIERVIAAAQAKAQEARG